MNFDFKNGAFVPYTFSRERPVVRTIPVTLPVPVASSASFSKVPLTRCRTPALRFEPRRGGSSVRKRGSEP